MKAKHLIAILDLSLEDIIEIINKTTELKTAVKKGEFIQPLKNKTLGMIFQKKFYKNESII